MKMVQRIISGLLSVYLAVSMLPMSVWAEEIMIEDVGTAEVETVPVTEEMAEAETMLPVVETTVPEETEPVQTIPETVPEETETLPVVQETVPEVTEEKYDTEEDIPWQAGAPTEQGSQLRALVEQQIRSYARSINRTNADDDAAWELAEHGVFGRGKTLKVKENHPLTATLMNAELTLQALTLDCIIGIEAMQQLNMQKVYGSTPSGWYDGGMRYHFNIYTAPERIVENRITSGQQYLLGSPNAYDETMVWVGGSVDAFVTMERKSVTADSTKYNIKVLFSDRFDFSGNNSSVPADIASLLGSVLFREFDWEATVNFTIEVPNNCSHQMGNYHWTLDAETKVLHSDDSGQYTKNPAQEMGDNVTYQKLDTSIKLFHNRPWVMEITVKNPDTFAFSAMDSSSKKYPHFYDRGRGHMVFAKYGQIVDNVVKYDYYGVKLSGNFTYYKTDLYRFRLENVINRDGSNMVYITGYNETKQTTVLETTQMNNRYRIEGPDMVLKETSSNGISGTDFIFNYLGNRSHDLSLSYFDLKVWENGQGNEPEDYFADRRTAPTCTARGYTTHTCSLCGYSYKDTYVNAKGHTYGDWAESVAPTCTAAGTERRDCADCDHFETRSIPALGHTQVTDEAQAPTCTETGLTEGSHCSVCAEVFTAQQTVPALGHSPVTDAAAEPDCEQTGLTEGSHCSVCEEILIHQETIPANGHMDTEQGDGFLCTVCGRELYFRIPQDYILLNLLGQATTQILADISPANLMDTIQWNVEDATVATVDDRGTITAHSQGSTYVTAVLTNSGHTFADRFRIDVIEETIIDGIQLSVNKLNIERYSADYVTLDVLLKLPQNYSAQSVGTGTETPDLGVAIESARFTEDSLNELFTLDIQDDRTLSIIPTEKGRNEAKGKYVSSVTVTVAGTEYESESLTLTVKNTLPKLKATIANFNSFYSGQSQEIKITGATVTNITADSLPDWLTLDGNTLTLTGENIAKNASGKAVLQVETEGWAVPVSVTLNVKNVYKEPTLKLSTTNVTLNPEIGDAAKITVTANPAEYQITALNFRLEDNKKNDKLDSGELNVTFQNGILTVSTTPSTPNGATYKLYISAGGSKEVVLTIKTVEKAPAMTLKAAGNIDLSIPENEVVVTPTFKNYSGAAIEDWEYSVAEMKGRNVLNANAKEFFTVEQEGTVFHVRCTEPEQLTMGNTYNLTLKLTLPNGSLCENTVKLTIRQTALKLKLSATSITLNKTVDDSAIVDVTSATKGYTLGTPVWQLMDKSGKNSAEGKLDIAYDNGKLTVSVNEETQFGAAYKLLVKASEEATATTLTVNIPAEAKSAITAALKATGGIDVIRDGTAITVTPTYKNCGSNAECEERLEIYSSADKYAEPVTDLFEIVRNENGSFTVAKSGAVNHSLKYQAKLVTDFGNGITVESKPVAIKVTMASAKLTANADSETMFAKDKNCRVTFTVTSTDKTLNDVARVEIKDKKYQNLLEVMDYGSGEFAIGYKNGKVDSSLIGKTVTLNLNVFLEGNETGTAHTTVKLKLSFTK